MHRITQEIPRRARVFDYGPLTLYGAIFHSLHLTVALPHRAPTTHLPFQSLKFLDRIYRINWIGFKETVIGFIVILLIP